MKYRPITAMSLAFVAFVMAGVTVSAPAEAQKKKKPAKKYTKYCDGPAVNWRLSLWGKRRAFTEGMEFVAGTIRKSTCGKFKILLYYGEQLSKSKENLDAISVGAIEAATFCAAYHPGKNRPLNVLDLPFLPLANFDVMRRVHDAVYRHPASKKALEKWNAQIYMSNILPQYEYMGRGKPPRVIADFKGKRLRALGGMGAAAKAIGAVPTTMPASETYTALQRGTVDAIGFPFSYTFAAYKLDEISQWYTNNLSAGNVNCVIAVNKDAYKKLPKQYKDILEGVKDGAYAAMIKAYAAKDKVNIPKWKKMGLKAVTFSAKDLDEFRKAGGKPVWDAWVARSKGEVPNAQELLDLVLKTAKGS